MAVFNYVIDTLNQEPNQPGLSKSLIRLKVLQASAVGVPQVRTYLQGGSIPAFINMVLIAGYWSPPGTNETYGVGTYNIDYKDIRGEKRIAEVNILAASQLCLYTSGAYNEDSYVLSFLRNDTQVAVSQLNGLTNPGGTFVSSVRKISIDSGITYKSYNPQFATFGVVWSNSEMAAMGLVNSVSNVYVVREISNCSSSVIQYAFIGSLEFTPMSASYTSNNVTSNAGTDGSINVNVVGGSGTQSFLWKDGVTTKNRTGLIAGSYSVTILDTTTNEQIQLIVQISEPGVVYNFGSLLEVPALNPITFVNENLISVCDNPQGLDNLLLCQQEYEGFDSVNYFQKLNKCNIITTQFNSDYSSFEITLRKYQDNTSVKSFTTILKEQNIGIAEDFNITIRNHTTVGQSRIYFGVGSPPIPLSINDSFTILNNANGYNGSYAIVGILNDAVLGYQYLVINKNFIGSIIQSGTGRFVSNNADFNVFESVMDFSDVPEGNYYIRIIAQDLIDSGNEITSISEPIDLKDNHEGVVTIRYRNFDNAFGVTWSTGFEGLVVIPAHFGHRRTVGGERSTSRNSDYTLVKINAKKTRGFILQTWSLPPYMHEKLSVIFDCDTYSINKIVCQSSDAYSEPEYKDRNLLSNSSIKLETKWFDTYNSDDIGSVADGGFIELETGFLKR